MIKTPNKTILNKVVENTTSMFSLECVEQCLNIMGISAKKVNVITSYTFTTYLFNLENLKDIFKLKKVVEMLEIHFNTKIDLQLNSNGCAFSLIFKNVEKQILPFCNCICNEFINSGLLSACIGYNNFNQPIIIDFKKQAHVLIAGATGAGKSVCLNSMISSLLMNNFSNEMQFIFIDCKKVELSVYNKLPHTIKVCNEVDDALQTLNNLCDLMDERYSIMEKQNLKEWNSTHIFCVIDELADLMLQSRYEIEPYLIRLSAKARACGIHLIIATQQPVVKVISGSIKANIITRIALKTASMRDSMNILDHAGAEKLCGAGDGLIKFPNNTQEIRFQTAFIQNNEIENIVNYWCNEYKKEVLK